MERTRFFYCEEADYTACEEHMAESLAAWFPEIAEECKGAMWNYESWDIDELIKYLQEAGKLTKGNFKRLGSRFGGPETLCDSLH